MSVQISVDLVNLNLHCNLNKYYFYYNFFFFNKTIIHVIFYKTYKFISLSNNDYNYFKLFESRYFW